MRKHTHTLSDNGNAIPFVSPSLFSTICLHSEYFVCGVLCVSACACECQLYFLFTPAWAKSGIHASHTNLYSYYLVNSSRLYIVCMN